jgi:hypothetical protein
VSIGAATGQEKDAAALQPQGWAAARRHARARYAQGTGATGDVAEPEEELVLGVARRVGGGGRATGIRIPDLELAAKFDSRKDVVYDGVMQRSIEQP